MPLKFMDKMKLYKFRSLGSEADYDRIIGIIENGFWCSKFSDLNDVMEGVFYSEKE